MAADIVFSCADAETEVAVASTAEQSTARATSKWLRFQIEASIVDATWRMKLCFSCGRLCLDRQQETSKSCVSGLRGYCVLTVAV